MGNTDRELTGKELKSIRNAVACKCANYDSEYGCLPLDAGCYMFSVRHTDSGLCRYFKECVLPTEPELEAAFSPGRKQMRTCRQCGRQFAAGSRRAYCSDLCASQARKQQTAARVRKHRERRRADGP